MNSSRPVGVSIRKSAQRAEGANPPLFLAISLLGLSLPVCSLAFERPKAYQSASAPKVAPELEDVYDLLYLHKPSPVWIRLHVRAEGQPIAARWDRYLEALFRDLDVNDDGFLDAMECERLPPPQMLLNAIQTGYVYPIASASAFSQLDSNRDGRVDRAELAAYFARFNVSHFRIQQLFDPDPYAGAINNAIFQLLDANGDGKLVKSECAAAEKWLDQYDLDEDECLTVQELVPKLLNGALPIQNQRPPTLNQFLISRPSEPPAGLAQRFLALYDTDKDYHLSHEESGLTKAVFDRLDRDRNGKLDIPELADFFVYAMPDVELWFEARRPNNATVITHAMARPETVGVQRLPDRMRVRLEFDESIDLAGAPPGVADSLARRTGARQNLLQTFKYLAGAKGFIDGKDLQKPALRGYQPFMTLCDRNRDGRLTLEEMTAFIDLHMRVADATVTVAVFRQIANWFTAMDSNRDGRLSRQELRDAWKSLSALQESPSEFLLHPDKRQRLQFVVYQGASSYLSQAPLNYLNPPVRQAPTAGPLWFRKMDRNGDGFVSRREFLGPKEQFDRIDRNGDGLIDLAEAERASRGK